MGMGERKLACIIGLCALLVACGGGGGGGTSITPPTQHVAAASTSSASATASGPIASFLSGVSGFRIQTQYHGLLDIYTSSSTTYVGAAPYIGEEVDVVGTGSVETNIQATTVTQIDVTAGTPAPLPTPEMLSLSGPVDLIDPTEFEIDTSNYGHMWIQTNSSTLYVGGAPTTGDYETIGGTGSISGGVTALIASQSSSAPATTTASGTIAGAAPYGFTLDVNATYSAVPIVLTASTVIAGTLEAGALASVTGAGSTATSITAVQIVVTDPTPQASPTPTPTPIAQTHVLTAGYLGAPDGTLTVTAAQAAPYLTWAQTGVGDADAVQAAGIETQIYEDPNRTVPDNTLYTTAADGGFAQTCSGTDVTDFTDNVTEYVMNPGSTVLQNAYANLLNSIKATANFNSVFQDDSGPLSEFSYTFSPSLPCDYTDAEWIAGGEALDQAATLPVVANGLSGLDGENPSELIQELSTSNVLGGNMEECYTSTSEPESDGWLWTATENTELQVNALGKEFWCMEEDYVDASANTPARIYAYASFLLTYNPSLDVMFSRFTTPSGLQVFPEEELVVLDPAVSTPASVSSLVQSGGAYGRVYNECFVAGKFVGACAVAINPTSGADVPFPFPQFTHTLTVSGYGVLDGGTLSTTGPAPPEYIDGVGAVIAFP